MKVVELRKLLRQADRVNLENAFVEAYKALHKNEKAVVDPTLESLLTGKPLKKKPPETVDYSQLDKEIETFIWNAKEQNYCAPNRIIPKSQRPKWRFLVKNYIKELSQVALDNPYYPQAVQRLRELYQLICLACDYCLFSTEDPFRSIGWEQHLFYDLLAKQTFAMGYNRENISTMLLCAVTGGVSREALHSFMERVLLIDLKTLRNKQMAVEEAKKLVDQVSAQVKKESAYSNRRFDLENEVKELCNFIWMFALDQSRLEEGLDYYFGNCMERNEEISLYRVLYTAGETGTKEQWLETYAYGLQRGIKPREYLQEQYKEMQEEGK